MPALVTRERARSHLRITHVSEDDEIDEKVLEASELVIAYLKDRANAFLDTSGDVIEELVPARVRAATLMMFGILWNNREGESGVNNPQFSGNELPPAVRALLYPLRTPTIA